MAILLLIQSNARQRDSEHYSCLLSGLFQAYLHTINTKLSSTMPTGIDTLSLAATFIASLKLRCSSNLCAESRSLAKVILLLNWFSVLMSAMISCLDSTSPLILPPSPISEISSVGVSRILIAVPMPRICSFPHTLQRSHVTQSIIREIFRNFAWKSYLISCLSCRDFQYSIPDRPSPG